MNFTPSGFGREYNYPFKLCKQILGQHGQALENFRQALIIAREVEFRGSEETVLLNIKSLSDVMFLSN
jgi:hypothetical protein